MIKAAQLYHNPRNYSDGTDIAKENGWRRLFDEVILKKTGKTRYYFNFKMAGKKMEDPDWVINAFFLCENWDTYSSLWANNAPKGLRHPFIYLLAITELSVKGFKREAEKVKEWESQGKTVVAATGKQDLEGTDFFVDGIAVQVKSPATLAGAKRQGIDTGWQ